MKHLWDQLMAVIRRAVRWSDRRLPRGLRSVVGVLLALFGVVGFLPIVGFWMLPVGVALIAMDIPALRARLLVWADRHDVEGGEASGRGASRKEGNRSPDSPFRRD
jgi:hypothetical protein